MYWFPKMYKTPIGSRFIVASNLVISNHYLDIWKFFIANEGFNKEFEKFSPQLLTH